MKDGQCSLQDWFSAVARLGNEMVAGSNCTMPAAVAVPSRVGSPSSPPRRKGGPLRLTFLAFRLEAFNVKQFAAEG